MAEPKMETHGHLSPKADSVRTLLIGLYALLVVLIVPHAGYEQGRSFFLVAKESTWAVIGDWPAAWCSLKIILLCFSALCLLCSGWLVMTASAMREAVDWAFLLLATAPIVGLWIGVYYLAKAIL